MLNDNTIAFSVSMLLPPLGICILVGLYTYIKYLLKPKYYRLCGLHASHFLLKKRNKKRRFAYIDQKNCIVCKKISWL